ncbi:hypothetical protein QTP88_013556 [Uroleucon formosanum]
MEKIISISLQNSTINQATGLKRLLTGATFIFWLTIFHKIMSYVDCLYNVVQAKNIYAVQIQKSINCFNKEILKIRDDITNICEHISKHPDIESTSKRRRVEDNINSKKLAALEICDVISIQAQSRFAFTKHLTGTKLIQNDKYEVYKNKFPLKTLNITVECYPFFVQERLKTELEDTFKDIFKLLKLLVVIPITSSEAERSFSMLKRITTCLRSTMCEERLNALTMLCIENCLNNEDKSFNQKVIDEFIKIKERRMDFVYKVNESMMEGGFYTSQTTNKSDQKPNDPLETSGGNDLSSALNNVEEIATPPGGYIIRQMVVRVMPDGRPVPSDS